MKMAFMIVAAALAAFLLLAGCAAAPGVTACTAEAKLCPDGSAVGRIGPNCEFAACPTQPGTGMANPASVNCVNKGYKSEIRSSADGSQYGVCIFPDKSECEEWAFYRGDCNYGMTKELCKSARGNWNECASACRGAPEGTRCTLQCVQECECGGFAGFGCPSGYTCTDYLPAGTADAMGVCKPASK